MAVRTLLARMVAWVRAGYPEGVPDHDYLPLFALLSRRLSEAEIAEVAAELQGSGYLQRSGDPAIDVRQAIEAVTNAPPSEAEVARVQRHLEAIGGDFDDPLQVS